jgi:hypothetical protein
MRRSVVVLAALVAAAAVALAAQSGKPAAPTAKPAAPSAKPASASPALPAMQKQASPQAVVNEHVDALNKCDWKRLMAQYPADAEIYLPGGDVKKGRAEVGTMFEGFVKAPKDGGLCGLTFKAEHTFLVGTTVNVQWVATAPFLAAPYRGADAYVTRDGLMAAQVTTFDGNALKRK